MRIISGKRARATIIGPKDEKTTRPITDRIKEALFSILGKKVVNAVVADLFCGTGSLGLEAISRGAGHAVMVDQDRDAFERLKKNLENLNFTSQVTAIKTNTFRIGIPHGALPAIKRGMENHYAGPIQNYQCNLVFLDPPFPDSQEIDEKSQVGKLMLKIDKQIAVNAIVVVRHESKITMLETYGTLEQYDKRKYGINTLSFYKKIAKDE
ncbi:MAG: RsmD family RNA methyltransferase [Phycisphaerae bacterium]|nr:RsmD family RNA methyltransferase [Phycisphaerae bacterium]